MAYRVRTRETTTFETCTRTCCGGDVYTFPPWRVDYDFESIEDVDGTFKRDQFGFAYVKPCITYSHHVLDGAGVKRKVGDKYFDNPPNPEFYPRVRDFVYNGDTNSISSSGHWPVDASLVQQLVPFPPGYVVARFGVDAFNRFDTQVPSEFSPIELVTGLLQIQELIPKITGNLLKDISKGILNWEFGIKSTIQDLRKLIALGSRVESILSDLRKTREKWIDLGHSASTDRYGWNPFVDPSIDKSLSAGPHFAWSWDYELESYESNLRAGAKRYHNLKDLDSMLSRLRTGGVLLGLGNPSLALWNAIPLSFVVDWLFGVDRLLSKQNIHRVFNGEWYLANHSTSVEVKAVVAVYQNNTSGNAFGSARVRVGSILVRRFQRVVGFPVETIFSIQQLTSLSPKQLLLLAALNSSR